MKNTRYIILFALLSILLILQLHNFQLFPINRGFDAPDHLDYVKYLKNYHSIPLPHEGWELYQPPLYYLLISTISNPFLIRFFNGAVFLFFIITVFFFFKKITKNPFLGMVGTVIISSLPVIVYSLPTISNELFSAILISLTIMYYASFLRKLLLIDKIIIGSLLGAALLSKATAFVLLFCIIIDQAIQNKSKVKIFLKNILVIIGIAFVIAGWFYIRNIIMYKNPFITSVDFPKYKIVQTPGYRDFKFFTDLSGFIKLDLFRAHHYSLLPGTYFSWFYDGHNVLTPVQPSSKAGTALVIWSIPMFIMLILGFIKEIKAKDKSHLIILYPLALFLSYIAYTIKLPFYSTVKGIFLISSIIPFTYLIVRFIVSLKKYYYILLIYLIVFVFLVIKNFWILKGWYNR